MNFLNRERERERERERRSQVLCWIYGGCKLGAKKKMEDNGRWVHTPLGVGLEGCMV